MTTRTASCHCGQLRVACEGEPRKVSMCHCADCKRRTGSAFSVAVFYLRDQVRVTDGVAKDWARPSVSGFPVTFHFCATCGSNVWWEPQRMPALVGVALGAFADPDFPAPTQSVATAEKCTWLSLPDDVVQFAAYPPGTAKAENGT
jgi:hypothetical protein